LIPNIANQYYLLLLIFPWAKLNYRNLTFFKNEDLAVMPLAVNGFWVDVRKILSHMMKPYTCLIASAWSLKSDVPHGFVAKIVCL
jgi:hypothetical protein